MHCDRVYAILTRGPFPSGDVTDVAVEIHLAHCASCRRLAEALRPVDAGPESLAADGGQLPGYRGDHPEWRADVAARGECYGHGMVSRPPARFRGAGAAYVGRLMAVVAVGIAIGILWSTVGLSQAGRERSGIASASLGGRIDGWSEARVQAQLIYGLDLPRACSRLDMALFSPLSADERSPAHLTESPPSFVNQCCTQCHVAGGNIRVGRSRRGLLIESCVICHGDSPRSARYADRTRF